MTDQPHVVPARQVATILTVVAYPHVHTNGFCIHSAPISSCKEES